MAELQPEPAGDTLVNEKPILTLKETKRLLGKATSKSIEDVHLMRTIALLSYLVSTVLDEQEVPKSEEV